MGYSNEHKGRITEVFIPGYRDSSGVTHQHMDVVYIGFELEILDLDSPFSGYRFIVIERDTLESASFYREDIVIVPDSVLDQLPGEGWDGPNKVFLNLSPHPCIQKWVKE